LREIAIGELLEGGVPEPQDRAANGRQRVGVGQLRFAEVGVKPAVPDPGDRRGDLAVAKAIEDGLDVGAAVSGCVYIPSTCSLLIGWQH
jgi:hypothetical protein